MIMNYRKKIFSFDAMTANGLWGQAFGVAAIVYNIDGTEAARFIGRCPIEGEVHEDYVSEMAGIPETHESYEALLTAFIEFYLANKADADVIVHMGLVEAELFLDANRMGLLKEFDVPCLIDISAIPEIGNDLYGYNRERAIGVHTTGFEESHVRSFDPIYNSAAAAAAYAYWRMVGYRGESRNTNGASWRAGFHGVCDDDQNTNDIVRMRLAAASYLGESSGGTDTDNVKQFMSWLANHN